MSATTAKVLRVATVVVFVLVAVLAYRAVRQVQKGDGPEGAKPKGAELTVPQAMASVATTPISVRGYVFDGGGTGLRICNGREGTRPPHCVGPFIDLYGVDRSSFALSKGTYLGRTLYWSDDSVAVYGLVEGSRMNVEQIFR